MRRKKYQAYNNFLTFGQGVLFATAIITGLVYHREELAMIEMAIIMILELFKEK